MIGVVGPEDSVALVLRVAAEMGIAQQVIPRAYEVPDQAPRLATQVDPVCQVILFTGRVPYSIARAAGSLRAHLDFVPHAGIDLYRSLVLLLRAYGGRLPELSIDTIEPDIIAEVWRDLGSEPPRAVLPLTQGAADTPLRSSDAIAAFHLDAWRAGTVEACVTCFRSVYDTLLAQRVPAFRVEHTRTSVRDALSRALQVADRTVAETHQIAVGLLDYASSASRVEVRSRLAALLHARVQPGDGQTDMLFTTWGTLRQTLQQHADEGALVDEQVALGFGLGATVPRAEENARRGLALARVERTPHVVFADGSVHSLHDYRHAHQPPAPGGMEARLPGAARALGMTSVSVRRVLDALQWLDTSRVSAQDLSDALGVGQRSARRILLRLQRHGVIEPSGTGAGPGAGRPRILYRVHPERLLALAGSDSSRG